MKQNLQREVEAVDALSTEELELLQLLPQKNVRGKIGQPGRPRFVYINGWGNQAKKIRTSGGYLSREQMMLFTEFNC